MKNFQEINLGLFFTRGMSLSKWDKIGTLVREIKPYQRLAESFGGIYLFTYGGKTDMAYQNLFSSNVCIVTKPKFVPVFLYSLILPFIQRKKLKGIQIVKTNQMDGSWSAVIAKKLYGSKLVIRCGYEWLQTIEKSGSSFLKRKIAYLIERFAYLNADQIVLTSEEIKEFVIKKFKIDQERIQIIQNFVDTDLFKPSTVEKEKGRIIFVGRLEKEKNLVNLFESLRGSDVILVIIGDGSLRSELEKLAIKMNLKVEFKGNIPQPLLPAELNKSDIFVLPSLYEGNPKVLLEAMACGLPCVGTNVSGIKEIITLDIDGILSSTDASSLKKAILTLLENKDLRDKLGKQARDKIEKTYDFESFIQKEVKLYQSII